MTEHIKVEESYVEALIKNAAWESARVGLVEKKDSGQKKGDEPKGKAKKDKDKPDFTTDARKGDKSKTHPGEEDFEEMAEAVEAHVCPLCESTLEEALTDEQIREHVSQIQDALQSIEEEDETVEEVASVDEDDKEDTNSKVMKKVDALRQKSAKG